MSHYWDAELLLFAIGRAVGQPDSRTKKDIKEIYSRSIKVSRRNLIATMLFGSPIKARYALNCSNTKRDKLISILLEPFV